MATVVLAKCWLTDVSTGTTVGFYSTGRSDERVQPGAVRRYAGGRLRSVTQLGRAQTLGVTAVAVPLTDLATLEAMTDGRVLLFRDTFGRKLYGAAMGLKVTDARAGARNPNAEFTLQQVTYSEAV